jgi:hypothetical protein
MTHAAYHETARLGVVHNGSQKTVSVTLGAMPGEQ